MAEKGLKVVQEISTSFRKAEFESWVVGDKYYFVFRKVDPGTGKVHANLPWSELIHEKWGWNKLNGIQVYPGAVTILRDWLGFSIEEVARLSKNRDSL